MATGKAAVLDRPMGTFHLEEFRVPDPAPGTVLLRQELAGCCATDAHTYLGQWPADFPVILGHENVGIVEAIGSGGALDFLGREVRVGDRVIARTGCCGTCYECRVAHQPRRCRNLRVRYGFSRAQDAPLSGGYGQYLYLSCRRQPLCSRSTRGLPLPRCTSPWGWRRMPCAARNPGSGAR